MADDRSTNEQPNENEGDRPATELSDETLDSVAGGDVCPPILIYDPLGPGLPGPTFPTFPGPYILTDPGTTR